MKKKHKSLIRPVVTLLFIGIFSIIMADALIEILLNYIPSSPFYRVFIGAIGVIIGGIIGRKLKLI